MLARELRMIGLARCAVLLLLILAAGQVCAAPTEPGYSADGLYNLANSYARAGKPGLAVLNYERADLLKPNDPDIEANLRYVLGPLHLGTGIARPLCACRDPGEPVGGGLDRRGGVGDCRPQPALRSAAIRAPLAPSIGACCPVWR